MSISDLAVFCLLALLLMVPVTIILSLLGIKRSIRHSRTWRFGLPFCIGMVFLLFVVLMGHQEIEQDSRQAQAWYYTHHLSSPRTFDNISFPAGSTVIQSTDDPHDVIGGTLPADTTLLGLPVHGDFSISFSQDSAGGAYLSEGVLARAAIIHSVPCAAGKFKHEIESPKESVDCTLSVAHAIGDVVMPAGSDVTANWDSDRPNDPELYGTVPRDWSVLGVHCAKGWFSYKGELTCTPAIAQHVAGYPLAAGKDVTVYREPDGQMSVSAGVLAEDFAVAGLRIPAGTTIDAIYDGHGISADRLRAHDMDENEYVKFDLPKNARMNVEGTVLQGDTVYIEVYATWVRAFVETDSDTDHVAMRNGEFDMATRKWQWKSVDD